MLTLSSFKIQFNIIFPYWLRYTKWLLTYIDVFVQKKKLYEFLTVLYRSAGLKIYRQRVHSVTQSHILALLLVSDFQGRSSWNMSCELLHSAGYDMRNQPQRIKIPFVKKWKAHLKSKYVCCHLVQKLFSSSLLPKSVKIKTSRTITLSWNLMAHT
jgi:hypothetical protein